MVIIITIMVIIISIIVWRLSFATTVMIINGKCDRPKEG